MEEHAAYGIREVLLRHSTPRQFKSEICFPQARCAIMTDFD